MLYEKLKDYSITNAYPMHMPGHKRNAKFMPDGLPCDIDITEIHGFDDLHNLQGVLLETSKLAASLYKSREALLLVNGTTVGMLAAIGAHTNRGDKILAVNNCHWSTPNAARLFGLDVVYITVETDEMSGVPCSVSPKAVKTAIEQNPDIKLIVITSPTYEGVISDVYSISEIASNAGCLLVVDGAHGAHLGFSGAFPESAIVMGADIVVVSLHKTLPALTQCSLLHVCSEHVDVPRVKELLSILQTSSPSYVLMASIDNCLQLLKSDGTKLFKEYRRNLELFKERIKDLSNLSVVHHDDNLRCSMVFAFDPGKIVIVTKGTGLSSKSLSKILRDKYKIEIERVCDDYVIAMTSICDTSEGFIRLAEALCEIDASILFSFSDMSAASI